MFKRYFKSADKVYKLLILTLSSSLLCTLWINMADADNVTVADEGGSAFMKYSTCGLLPNDVEMLIYYAKKNQSYLKLVYTLWIKENINRSLLHLESRAGLYIESDHMTLHIQSLKITDTGFYHFGVEGHNCQEINILKVQDADNVTVADEGGSAFMKYSTCGLLPNDVEMLIYYAKKNQNDLKLVYTLGIKENISLLHLESRAGLYIEFDHMILHIQSLKITDTGFYHFGMEGHNCQETHILKVQGTPVLKINNTDLGGIANLPDGGIGNIICEKEGSNSSAMAVKLNEQILSEATEYSPSKVNDFYLKTVTLQISHKFTIEDADKMLVCSSNDSKLERKVTIDITVNPIVSITKVSSVKAREEVTIICTCKGRPATEMYWLKNDVKLKGENKKPISEGKLVKVENHLKFSPNIADNKKILSCVTVNSTIKDEMTLDVTYAPENVQVSSKSVDVKNGSLTKDVTCSGSGNPEPIFIWMFKGKDIAFGYQLSFIRPLTPNDDGEYSCKVINSYGSRTDNLMINVLYAPICTHSVIHIKYHLKTLKLTCSIDSKPRPTSFIWFHNEDKAVVGSSDTIDVTYDGNSTYYCEAQNSEGVSSPRCEFQIYFSESLSDQSPNVVLVIEIVVPIICVLLLAAIITAFICRKLRNKKIQGRKNNDNRRGDANHDLELKLAEHEYASIYDLHINNLKQIPELNVCDLKYLETGNFYVIYRGKFKMLDFKLQNVAVKILKDFANVTNQMEKKATFFCELDLHSRLSLHINVIRCFGRTTINGIPGIVCEYAENGTLKNWLQNWYHQYSLNIAKKKHDVIADINFKCMKFSREVAAGMAHLSRNKIVHRYLSAQNILLDANDVCKVSDFRLAQIINTSEYNIISEDTTPLCWLSPESLFQNVYSHQSDVWSFGILLWEIITLGGKPYYTMKTVSEFQNALKSHYRMPPPKHCCPEIYEIMTHCWLENPQDRPTFDLLEETLSTFLSNCKEYLDFTDYDRIIYENINTDTQIYGEKS